MSEHTVASEKSSIATPSNVITLTRILLVPVFVAALLAPWPEWFGLGNMFSNSWKSVIAAAIFILISGTDWLDGYLARSRNEITDLGKFMDPLADKILVTAALICLVELGDLPTWPVLIILAREFIVSGVRMVAASKGEVIAASMIGKFKTVFQMIAIVLFTLKKSSIVSSFGPETANALWWFSWLIMVIALGLTIASMLDYLVKAREFIGLGSAEANVDANDSEHETALLCAKTVEMLSERNMTFCTAESLTGGMIGSSITSVPGSSRVFKGGIISYTNDVKNRQLGVDEHVLDQIGAVSEQTAEQMAQGALDRLQTDISVSVTGLAGPDADEFGNPVGTVCFGLCTRDKVASTRRLFSGDRASIRLQTTQEALRLVCIAINDSSLRNLD